MTLKQKLLAGYFGIGLLFLLYFWIFDSTGFGYALGKGLVWPAVLFPGFGAFLGGVILLAFLAFVMIS